MARERTLFVCQGCGYQTARWMGRCPDCGGWETLVEEAVRKPPGGGGEGARAGSYPVPIGELERSGEPRRETGIGELDRVLGGGLVAGSVVLVGGDPGIGKSTLVLQAAAAVAGSGRPVLYVTGEESGEQIRLRADRLGIGAVDVRVLCETSLERMLEQIRELTPALVIVDSVQTAFSENLASAPGSVGQVRECAARLVVESKRTGTASILVGHVTKDGSLAGPRVLEHMVDTVLYFEGDRGHAFRVLRAVKNRFGSTNEVGVFEMAEAGLVPVENPSEVFLAERPVGVPGSVVVASMEGTRPILVEIQALVSPSAFGTARRTTLGIESNRVALLVAVLEKKMGLQLTGQDVFVNVAGGFRITEPAADLGVLVAIASSFLDRPVDPQTLVVGEVGLAGEVRAVGQVESRVREAAKMGFTRCLVPASVSGRIRDDGCRSLPVRALGDVWEILFA